MTWVAEIYREFPNEFIATMRETFGVSLADLGGSLLEGELVALTKIAYEDGSTRLGAAVKKWGYRATFPELMQVASLAGKKADQVLPWGIYESAEERAARHVSEVDIAAGRKRLAAVSAFRHMDGFEG